ncbi:hypothetical protein APR50_40350 [Variovorax paradoxus]|mgnify:CR=1 FL=1|jgi:hypothetical protein|uniref:DUF2501 domain-containing protein n=1 Tax=Variovorax paradoxus TaxID=34073 RepID=UPI0006E57345|nr:hypothetical protein APR52_40130 [Variovorax paradoxus]KPU91878.1 hypothetical protein APR50_40350 [Variovorax paradoxus]KPV01298.1 hypothetical protein APR49_31635 [Variovorax paradoxus]KPV19687.1 hypothetical protein APR51_19605 [Variovorax paradoxus]KPV25842.1 hypothetical protein APR48_32730 [Variovorax paradoxus]
MKKFRSTLIALALLAAGASANAESKLLDQLKNQMGGGGASSAGNSSGGAGGLAENLGFAMPAIGNNTMGNAAGVLQYCIKNNYLGGGDAASVKDKLMAKITGQKQQQSGFASGAKGLLKGGDGQTLNFKLLSSKVKEKGCDYVLKNATRLL